MRAMTMPLTRAPKLLMCKPKIEDVRLCMDLQSTDNLLVKVPALFFDSSKKGIGILNNFLYVSILILQANFSPTYDRKYTYNVHKTNAASPTKKNQSANLSVSSLTSFYKSYFNNPHNSSFGLEYKYLHL